MASFGDAVLRSARLAAPRRARSTAVPLDARARSESDTSTPSVARAGRSTRSGSGALRASRRSATAAALGRRAGTAVALGRSGTAVALGRRSGTAVALGLRRRAAVLAVARRLLLAARFQTPPRRGLLRLAARLPGFAGCYPIRERAHRHRR